MNSTPAKTRIGKVLGKRLIALVLMVVVAANLMCWSYPAIWTWSCWEELLIGIVMTVVFGCFLVAGVLAWANWNRRTRLSIAIVLHSALLFSNYLSFKIFHTTSPVDQDMFLKLQNFHVFAVAGLSGAFFLVRITRNVRIDLIDQMPLPEKPHRKGMELALLVLYWFLSFVVNWALSAVTKLQFSVSSGIAALGLLAPAYFVVSLAMMFIFLPWFGARRYILVSGVVVSLMAFVATPAVGLILFYSAPVPTDISLFLYSREFTRTATVIVAFTSLLAATVIGLRLMGYQLIWPNIARSKDAKEKGGQDQVVADPWD